MANMNNFFLQECKPLHIPVFTREKGLETRRRRYIGNDEETERRNVSVSELSQISLAEMPAYTEQDTKERKKAHYGQIVEKFREADCANVENLVYLIDTINQMSPEIYEHYRGLQDLFRAGLKAYLAGIAEMKEMGPVYRIADPQEKEKLEYCLNKACENGTLLREKYSSLNIQE